MKNKFKDKLIGERITLKRTKPTLKIAQSLFSLIAKNREHLRPWFPWEKKTKKIKDSLKYLFDKEEEAKKGEKIEYGIYRNKEYLGNIAIFRISEENKSGEIGYWLSSEFIKNGYMTEAVKILETEFFNNFRLNRLIIRCDEKNKASIGVAKKCKYILEGKFRKDAWNEHINDFRNTLIFSKLKSEFK